MTLLEKCSRYFGNCAWVVRADQRRKTAPAARAEDGARFSLPTTTFQGSTSHFLARPLRTYGSLRAKASALLLSSTWKTSKARSTGSASAPPRTAGALRETGHGA